MKTKAKTEFIQDISSWNSGGGTILDLVTLKSGKIIAISEEIAVLYKSMEDLVTGETLERPSIIL